MEKRIDFDETTEFTLCFGSIFAVLVGVVLVVFSKPLGIVGLILGLCMALFGLAMLRWLIRNRRKKKETGPKPE